MSLRPQTSIPSVPDETARVTEQMDITTPHGELLFGIFGSLVQYVRTFARERVVAGLVAAKRRGRKGGYPPRSTRTRLEQIVSALDASRCRARAARHLGERWQDRADRLRTS